MLPVVTDTNMLFSALLGRGSRFSETVSASERQFYAGELALTELFKHKERIVEHSRLSEEEVVALYYKLVRKINLHKEDLIAPEHRRRAYELCHDIDETDTPHVALVFELDGELWTGDKKLKEGLREKGFDRFFEPE